MHMPTQQIQLGSAGSVGVIAGPCPPQDVPIPATGMLIGRGVGADLNLAEDDAVSHHHARLVQQPDGTVSVADAGSTNGTYLNGVAIVSPSSVKSDDIIKVGHTDLVVRNVPSPADPMTQVIPETTNLAAAKGPQHSGTGQAPGSESSPEDQALSSAKAAYGRRDYAGSAAAFGKLISSPSHAAEAYYGLGMIALTQGRAQDGEKLFKASLGADPAYANSWYQLGQLAESQSPSDASRFYREALRHNPRHAGAIKKLQAASVTGTARPAEVPRPSNADVPGSATPDSTSQPTPPHSWGQRQTGTGREARTPFAYVPPAPTVPPAPITAPTVSGHIRGRVVGFQRRAEQSFFLHRLYLYVWDFRIERPNMPPVMVEMRGYRFTGDISNGDEVDIAAHSAQPGRVLRVRQLTNLTSSAVIKTSYGRGRRTLAATSKILVSLIILAAVIGVGIYI
jgi:TolA-binding protein